MNFLARDPIEEWSTIPATGAWQEGDPSGNRKFIRVKDRPFVFEGGSSIPEITLAYESFGSLNAARSNAILICHALTGDSHVSGSSGPGHPTEGWWNEIVGPGKAIDTDRYFVVCVNVLGGCQGSSGPASLNPLTGKAYAGDFPIVSVRDSVRSQALLANHLEIKKWLAVIGGSLGGMQVLEWAIMFPERVGAAVTMAAASAASAMQIGLSEAGRLAIAQDPHWNNGEYYDRPDGKGPHEGLMLARRIAQLTYRSDVSFEERFGRDLVDPLEKFQIWDRFQIESYLDYHGLKLALRFDANTYLLVNKATDLHDVGRDRGGIRSAFRRIRCPILIASITTDVLYTPRQQQQMRDDLLAEGVEVSYQRIDSPDGHDAFLTETEQVAAFIEPFIERFAQQ